MVERYPIVTMHVRMHIHMHVHMIMGGVWTTCGQIDLSTGYVV
jgi:hypothetical protein